MIEHVYLMHCYSHDYSLICLVARNKVWYDKWQYLKAPTACSRHALFFFFDKIIDIIFCHVEKRIFLKAAVILFDRVDITTQSELDIWCSMLCCIWTLFLQILPQDFEIICFCSFIYIKGYLFTANMHIYAFHRARYWCWNIKCCLMLGSFVGIHKDIL